MINPCKESKCISFPVCLSKQKIKCNLLAKHIGEYITEKFGIVFSEIEPGSFSLKYERSAELWKYLNSFLINLNEVTISVSWGESGLYKLEVVLQQTKNSSYRCVNVIQSTPKVLKKKSYNQAYFPDGIPKEDKVYERPM